MTRLVANAASDRRIGGEERRLAASHRSRPAAPGNRVAPPRRSRHHDRRVRPPQAAAPAQSTPTGPVPPSPVTGARPLEGGSRRVGRGCPWSGQRGGHDSETLFHRFRFRTPSRWSSIGRALMRERFAAWSPACRPRNQVVGPAQPPGRPCVRRVEYSYWREPTGGRRTASVGVQDECVQGRRDHRHEP